MSETTTKKIKRTANNVSNFPSNNSKKNIHLADIFPLTISQKVTFEQFRKGKDLVLAGSAGTGKTFMALYLALKGIIDGSIEQSKILIVRSAVPTREIGYLPGDVEEKAGIYELAYASVLSELTGNKNAYFNMKADNIINFVSSSFLRGITYRDTLIIVDEFTSMNYHELSTIITRAGENCRFIFCGDTKQSDLKKIEKQEHVLFLDVLSHVDDFVEIKFTPKDVVRSGKVKKFLLADEKYGPSY